MYPDEVVHPAHHGLREAAVGAQHGAAEPDRAETESADLRDVAVEAGERLSDRGGDRGPEVVVRMLPPARRR
jgi:hypothetical protein